MMDLRKTFTDTLVELAEKDDKIVFIIPDVGFRYVEKFAEKFPDRYFNLGVTEQSSMIIASAMALSGMKPYIYSMINFMVFRPYEMVRNAVNCHNANVKILGVKGSEKYKFLGFSHNMLTENEDLKVLEHMENINTYVPYAEEEVRDIVLTEYARQGPAYIRL